MLVKIKPRFRNHYQVSDEDQQIIEFVYNKMADEFRLWAKQLGEEVTIPPYHWSLGHLEGVDWWLYSWIKLNWCISLGAKSIRVTIEVNRFDKEDAAIKLANTLETNLPNWLPKDYTLSGEVEVLT